MSLFTKVYRLDKWSKNIKDDYYRLCVMDNWKDEVPLTDELIKTYGERVKQLDQETEELYHPMNVAYLVCVNGLDITPENIYDALGGI